MCCMENLLKGWENDIDKKNYIINDLLVEQGRHKDESNLINQLQPDLHSA